MDNIQNDYTKEELSLVIKENINCLKIFADGMENFNDTLKHIIRALIVIDKKIDKLKNEVNESPLGKELIKCL